MPGGTGRNCPVYTARDDQFGPAGTSDPEFSLHVDGGIVVVRRPPGVEITGPLATKAMDTVDELTVTTTAAPRPPHRHRHRDPRGAGGVQPRMPRSWCMALVGRSAVDRVPAELRTEGQQHRHPVAVLQSLPAALAWLREHEQADIEEARRTGPTRRSLRGSSHTLQASTATYPGIASALCGVDSATVDRRLGVDEPPPPSAAGTRLQLGVAERRRRRDAGRDGAGERGREPAWACAEPVQAAQRVAAVLGLADQHLALRADERADVPPPPPAGRLQDVQHPADEHVDAAGDVVRRSTCPASGAVTSSARNLTRAVPALSAVARATAAGERSTPTALRYRPASARVRRRRRSRRRRGQARSACSAKRSR